MVVQDKHYYYIAVEKVQLVLHKYVVCYLSSPQLCTKG
uniref:Uncharacterized protein n=1 Tax=Anguilla anguilla TaxID=7936 RepID=A0A0E9W077_ANGAN